MRSQHYNGVINRHSHADNLEKSNECSVKVELKAVWCTTLIIAVHAHESSQPWLSICVPEYCTHNRHLHGKLNPMSRRIDPSEPSSCALLMEAGKGKLEKLDQNMKSLLYAHIYKKTTE